MVFEYWVVLVFPHQIYQLNINECLSLNSIPSDQKIASLTPLFKNKGDRSDINNYRSISVLPPIAKIFEKLLSKQIKIYFNTNSLFYKGQHGFREGHSCETALDEFITAINHSRDNKLLTMILFIDFRKAVDLVDSNLLIYKLFHYGFDNISLRLLTDYFTNRQQMVFPRVCPI